MKVKWWDASLVWGMCIVFAILVGCNSFVTTTMLSMAAAQGTIVKVQAQYQSRCVASPTLQLCQDINKAIAAQNAAISGLEAYCQLPIAPDAATLASQGSAVCNPNPSAKSTLVSEVSALNTIVQELKPFLGGTP